MDTIIKHINYIYNTYHSSNTNYDTSQRLSGISNGYEQLIDIAKNNYENDAKEYFNKRTHEDKKLKKIQKNELKNIKKCLNGLQFDIIPASSFSAKVNVIGESDLDFMVRIKDMHINIKNNSLDDLVQFSNRLGSCGYIFSEVKSKEDVTATYYVFTKNTDNVDIEVKVRDFDGSIFVAKLHDYSDNKLDMNSKIYTTYIKQFFKLPENKKQYADEYWKFKLIYTESAMYKTGATKLIMPLEDIKIS